MPYKLTYKNKGFFIEHTGLVTIDEINEANGLIHGHDKFDEHKFQIIDLLNADFSRIDFKNANQPGATDSVASKTRENVKVAIVVTDEEAIKFCERYISEATKLGSTWSFKIFSDMNTALEWAGNRGR